MLVADLSNRERNLVGGSCYKVNLRRLLLMVDATVGGFALPDLVILLNMVKTSSPSSRPAGFELKTRSDIIDMRMKLNKLTVGPPT
jgi:hypothetical protein